MGFADWLEAVAGERMVEQEEIVGYHLERAYLYREELGLPEDANLRRRAAEALSGAGMRAEDRGDVIAATRLLRAAADLSEGDPAQLRTLTHLGEAFIDAAEYDEALLTFERLERAAAVLGDAAYRVRGRAGVYECRVTKDPASWDLASDRALGEEAQRVFRERAAEDLMPYAFDWLSDTAAITGSNAGALDLASEELRLARGQRYRRYARQAASRVINSLEYGATPLSTARERAEEFVASSADDRSALSDALFDRAWVNAWLGRVGEVAADLGAARSIDEELGRRSRAPFLRIIEGYVAWLEQGPAAAEPLFNRAHRTIKEIGSLLTSDYSGVPLARVLLELGRDLDAGPVVSDLYVNRAVVEPQIQARSMDAVLAARRGELDEALRLSDEAEALAAPTDCLIDQADVALDRAEVLKLAGRPAEAREAAEVALGRFERKEYAIGVKRARAFLARLDG